MKIVNRIITAIATFATFIAMACSSPASPKPANLAGEWRGIFSKYINEPTTYFDFELVQTSPNVFTGGGRIAECCRPDGNWWQASGLNVTATNRGDVIIDFSSIYSYITFVGTQLNDSTLFGTMNGSGLADTMTFKRLPTITTWSLAH